MILRPLRSVLFAGIVCVSPGLVGFAPTQSMEALAGALRDGGMNQRAPDLGETAPDVMVRDTEDNVLRVFEQRGSHLVIEFVDPANATAMAKIEAMNALRAKYAENPPGTKPVQFWVVVSTGDTGADGRARRPQDAQGSREEGREERMQAAKALQARVTNATVVADTPLDSVRFGYGGLVNMAFVVDPEGRVIVRQPWCDPSAIEQSLDAATGRTGSGRVASFRGETAPPAARANRGPGRAGRQALPMARALVQEGAEAFIAKRDRDASSSLNQAESGLPGEMFRRADANSDGELDKMELETARRVIEERLQKAGVAR